eukprot:TRINITY_DN68052_c0_g1_i1.p1 TRINITY_DN68052_c0_g1~~TRINITY_DN68052_c0_g1_i1.p1  ORF type:complete len:175 (+),score=29.37 TRINITY_DN68052_c0_g1_i1:52-525(+)
MAASTVAAVRRTWPVLVSGSLAGAGTGFLVRELRRELPPPCEVVACHLQDPEVQKQLGFEVSPLSVRLWHGPVSDHFARVTVPLFEQYAFFPSAAPFLRIPWWRSSVHAAVELGPTGWKIVSMLEDTGKAAASAAGSPRRTDDIIAAESGTSVDTSE